MGEIKITKKMKYLITLFFIFQIISCNLISSDSHEVLIQDILDNPTCDFQQNIDKIDSLSNNKIYAEKIKSPEFQKKLNLIAEDIRFYNEFKQEEIKYKKLSNIIHQYQNGNPNIEVKAIENEYVVFIEKILSDLIELTSKAHENNENLGRSVKKITEFMGESNYVIRRSKSAGIINFAGLNTEEQFYFEDNFGVPKVENVGNLKDVLVKYAKFIEDFRDKLNTSRKDFIRQVEINLRDETEKLQRDKNYLDTKEDLARQKLCAFRAVLSGNSNDYARYQYKVNDMDFNTVRNRLVPNFNQYKIEDWEIELEKFKKQLSEIDQKYKNTRLPNEEVINEILHYVSFTVPKGDKIIVFQPISCNTTNILGSSNKTMTVLCVNTFEIDSFSGKVINHYYDFVTNENDIKFLFGN